MSLLSVYIVGQEPERSTNESARLAEFIGDLMKVGGKRDLPRPSHQQAKRNCLRVAVGKPGIRGIREQQLAPVRRQASQGFAFRASCSITSFRSSRQSRAVVCARSCALFGGTGCQRKKVSMRFANPEELVACSLTTRCRQRTSRLSRPAHHRARARTNSRLYRGGSVTNGAFPTVPCREGP